MNQPPSFTCMYKCMKCDHYFEKEKPGPTECPNCGHLYVEWLNYKEVKKDVPDCNC